MTNSRPLDLTGQQIGKWAVIKQVPRPSGMKTQGMFWLARCTCGTEQVHSAGKLNARRGDRGCAKCRGHLATAGGMTPEYQSWRGMRERCLNPNHASYRHYGGRGIKVCDRWLFSFSTFSEAVGKREAGHSLDRIDNEGDYEPTNCRWADVKTQMSNTRSFRLTDSQISAILNLLSSGAKQVDIAEALAVARSHIANIATGHSRGKASPKAREIREARNANG